MTIDTFIEKQKEYNLKYKAQENGCLRSEGDLCPIAELGYKMFSNEINPHLHTPGYYNSIAPDIGHAMGLSKEDSEKIILEADGHIEGEIRKQLMEL